MSFISVPTLADVQHKDILIVGDYWDNSSIAVGKQFGVAQEGALEQGLHMAGLTKGEVEFTSLFPRKSNPTGLWMDNKKAYKRAFTEAGKVVVRDFLDRVKAQKPKVIVPLGPIATQAMLNRTDYGDIRGYPFPYGDAIIIPSMHPRDMIWSNYIWRFYLANDLNRAARFARGELKIVYPDLHILDNFELARDVLETILCCKRVSIDIEVSNYEVSCLGFSMTPNIGYSLPIDNRWTDVEETKLWQMSASILGNPHIKKIGQNFIFDTYFLAYRMGIITRGYIEDTMMAHSIQYPDFLKGLGFLGGVHTTYTYWKDEMDFKNIKEES